jgi:hypothetical protein
VSKPTAQPNGSISAATVATNATLGTAEYCCSLLAVMQPTEMHPMQEPATDTLPETWQAKTYIAHIPEQERQQQRPDVCPVNICISEQHNLAIPTATHGNASSAQRMSDAPVCLQHA